METLQDLYRRLDPTSKVRPNNGIRNSVNYSTLPSHVSKSLTSSAPDNLNTIKRSVSSKVLSVKKSELITDEKSLEYFKSQDLSRNRFSYDILVNTGWWPDEMVTFLEILRLAYTNFINTYTSQPSIFDDPIRVAIYFMNQRNYSKIPEISRYLKLGNFEIPDNYLNYVINEDNCYMHGLEERPRSKNEQKHYQLTKALDKLLEYTPITQDELVFKKEHEVLVRIYLSVYSLKNMYAIVDDTFRNMLSACLSNNILGVIISEFIEDLIKEIDTELFSRITSISDVVFYGKLYTFRDLLLFALDNTLNFSYMFNFKRDPKLNLSDPERLSFTYLSKNYDVLYTPEVVKRIQHVYKYYYKLLVDKYQKDNLILGSSNFDTLLKVSKDHKKIIEPVYLFKTQATQENSYETSTFYIDRISAGNNNNNNNSIPIALEKSPRHLRTGSENTLKIEGIQNIEDRVISNQKLLGRPVASSVSSSTDTSNLAKRYTINKPQDTPNIEAKRKVIIGERNHNPKINK